MSRPNSQTARTRERRDRMAPKYDRMMSWNDRILFGDGRAWVCSRAHGDVLEIAIATARNLAFYPDDPRLTGMEARRRWLIGCSVALLGRKNAMSGVAEPSRWSARSC